MIPLRDDNPTEITPVVTVHVYCDVRARLSLRGFFASASKSSLCVYVWRNSSGGVWACAIASGTYEFACVWDAVLQHVFARRLDASHWKHAVFVDLWQ